jgi:hypothetical protein
LHGRDFPTFTFCEPGAPTCPDHISCIAVIPTSTFFISELSSWCVARCWRVLLSVSFIPSRYIFGSRLGLELRD